MVGFVTQCFKIGVQTLIITPLLGYGDLLLDCIDS